MKKAFCAAAALITAAVMSVSLTGCGKAFDTKREGIPRIDLRANIEDVSADNAERDYRFTAGETDEYTFSAEGTAQIQLFDGEGKQLAGGQDDVSAPLTEGKEYFMKITTEEKNTPFAVRISANGDGGRSNPYMPFENIFTQQEVQVEKTEEDPLKPCTVEYKKREGGTYIYSNNPEMMAPEDLGAAIIRTEHMSGMYNFTYEHSNHTGHNIFLGYQLLNTSETEDAVVTVYNIGFQVDGEWLGQRSWSDFYNLRFELPSDYFDEEGKETWYYKGQDFLDYTPRVFEPTTYRIPAGQYIYVLGGTSADAYNHTNVAGTADKQILKGRCSNAAVQFSVTGGDVTGTFYPYNDPAQVQANPPEQGHIDERDGKDYGGQYKGTDPHLGLIEANLCWTVNDKTPAGRLPVTYEVMYDPNASSVTTPFAEYHSVPHTINADNWQTSLNPQNSHRSIGTDMMVFNGIDPQGNPIIIDNEHADGRGQIANTGNWMVTYNDNITLVNTGDKPRTFRVYKSGSASGALMSCVRDREGKVLNALMNIRPLLHNGDKLPDGVDASRYVKKGGTFWPIIDGVSFDQLIDDYSLVCTVTVEPMSYTQFTVDYLILGNSCGGINHWITVD
ncbi:MAG: hypothetical protein HFJ80_05055 [Clostridiales bacterium]|nr:hypothetical protein [Clostridiales bacterium]